MEKRYLLKIGKCYLQRDVDLRPIPPVSLGDVTDWVIMGDCKITNKIDSAYMFTELKIARNLVDQIGGKVVEVTFKVKNA